jgi:hypothetical protein
MNIPGFWNLIDLARADAAAADDPELALAAALTNRLAAFSKQEIFEYQEQFDRHHEALYRWDVWGAAYLIGGGCSDDSFIDFRAGLITQGRDWFERAAASPDALAEHPAVTATAAAGHDEALFNELVNYAAAEAYARISGTQDHGHAFYQDYRTFRSARPSTDPTGMGENFDFEDAAEIRARLPQLARLFRGDPGA